MSFLWTLHIFPLPLPERSHRSRKRTFRVSVLHNVRHGHAHKRIKTEDLGSDDTVCDSISTPSFDGTVIASDDADSISLK